MIEGDIAVISDIGWRTFLKDSQTASAASYGDSSDIRRLAPELLSAEETEDNFTIETDVYSYGSVILGSFSAPTGHPFSTDLDVHIRSLVRAAAILL